MSNFHNNSNILLNNSTHPIIQQKNTFSLDKKFLTVHANDREQFFYNTNVFSIKTPQSYNNVESLRLMEINFPSKINNFSRNLNNNFFYINQNTSPINIPNGNYTQQNLATFITNNISQYNINVQYLVDRQRFIFFSDNSFSLNFQLNTNNCDFITKNNSLKHNTNNPHSNNNIDVFNIRQTSNRSLIINEGFFYDIGFDIVVNLNNPNYNIYSRNDVSANSISSDFSYNNRFHYIISDSPPRFRDQQPIYMEIDSLNNNYDEINPFPIGTNNMFSNLSHSSTRTAFIKIPPLIYNNPSGFQFYNNQSIIAFFEAPIKRIQNLKFKFRYHDNKLVDIDNQDVNFTLEINQLRSNMHRDMNIQTPIL